jgi:hypothetical protein
MPGSAKAQAAATASLGSPNLNAFPHIEIYLDVHDAQGESIHELRAEQIRILEDGLPLPPIAIDEFRPGVQVVVAINPGPSLGIRNSQGISRYETVKETLAQWAKGRQGSTLDDWSLLINGGPSISHVSDPKEWLSALESDQVNPRTAIPSLDTLFRAASLAADPTPRPGMGRAILFITPPPEGKLEQPLQNLTAQSMQQNTPIFIWVVSSTGGFQTTNAKRLGDLAQQTGGKIFTYTGEEALPTPEEYLEPLRLIYRLSYLSKITTGGTHQLAVQVQNGNLTIESNSQSFEIDLQPPTPAFVSPPIEIQRKLPSQDQAQDLEEINSSSLNPKLQTVQAIFDFPDGRKRPLVRTALYVDGALAAENLAPPFDQFIWRLDNYTEDGTHSLRIEAQDALGLVGNSIELPVLVSIELPKRSAWAMVQRNLPIFTGLAVVLAGAVLLLVLVLGGRLRPKTQRATREPARKADPLTQPVPIKQEEPSRHISGWVNRLQWPQRNVTPKALAFLSRISETDNMVVAPPVPVTSNEITLGSDPNQATLMLDDPSIEGLHARLIHDEGGSFRLTDEGSIAGTWINFTPVPKGGATLEHGDLIHIGRVGFRFTLRQPSRVRKPVIIPEVLPQENPQ